ncbi:MAG: DUF389 domain-containing protein [Mesonia hippocampi]|uniref:DUF389 domain-containing protein n=1 Tax=Mesonia hippocampi TaxID=1628250 RepID=UPI003F9AF8BD
MENNNSDSKLENTQGDNQANTQQEDTSSVEEQLAQDDAKKEELKKEIKGTFSNILRFVSELLDIRQDTDRDSTIEAVKKDIIFKGHNAWILIFSVFVASIGLNVSSTAVVIGAMLISPLMGPIVGVGLSVAINDVDTLRRSLINLGVMVGLSVITAFFYFSITPLTGSNAELEARTYPTILDVLVAIFGGLALIVAKTKKGTIASVIFGVAIATALMPPLCTVGFGLAEGRWADAFGALYLFSINATFIALSTFLVSKLLGFPLVKYANSKRRRLIARAASIIAIIVMVPSVYLFYNMLQESYFAQEARSFVAQELQPYQDAFLQKNATVIDYRNGYEPRIEVSFLGKEIPNSVIDLWRSKLKANPKLQSTSLIILQNKNTEAFDELAYMHEFKKRDSISLLNKDERIRYLEGELMRLERYKKQQIPFQSIASEVKINYEHIAKLSYADKFVSNFKKVDTIPEFIVEWDSKISLEEKIMQEKKLREWLVYKLDLDTLVVSRAKY